jgi:prepilin-type N-terminal cleavage/methylation domain-containing protein
MHAARRSGTADPGYTLLEVMVVMLIMSLLAGFSATGWVRYQRSLEGRNASSEVVALLRDAHERALAEATTYCVSFGTDGRSYRLWRASCTTGTAMGPALTTPSPRVTFTAAAFTQSNGTTLREVRFSARGSATPGSVSLRRDGSNHTYRISVEGLTGRVSLNG